MFKFKKKKKMPVYQVLFCTDNDEKTAFHHYGTYETYEKADHVIRMGWNKKEKQKIKNGYKVDDAWIVIKKSEEE